MNSNRWEVALLQKLVQFGSAQGALDKDNSLVKLQLVKKLVQSTILLLFIKLDVVLLQAVKSELGLIVYVNLKRVLHEFLADRSDFLRKSRAEHHHLLLCWSGSEDLLDVAAHVCDIVNFDEIFQIEQKLLPI